MKFIYLTSHKYPSSKVEPFFIRSMAESFAEILGAEFSFVVRGAIPGALKKMDVVVIKSPKNMRTAFYFILLPVQVFLRKWGGRENIFFSSDPYLLSVLIFWRKLFGFKYLICSDWHQLFEDWRDRYVSGNSDYLISTSRRLKNLLVSSCGVGADKILVAYGGVNKDLYDSKSKEEKGIRRKKLGLPMDKYLVGYVGGFKSIGQEKGIGLMIKCLSFLDEGISLALVGGRKNEIEEYRKLAWEEKTEARCIFVEKRPFDSVVEYELAMDVLVIPYPDEPHFRDYGFPMKVWEYMASGRPIIYSNLEIIAEALSGRATPFEPGNPQSLAKAIVSVRAAGEAALAIAEKNTGVVKSYTWQGRARRILEFMNKK